MPQFWLGILDVDTTQLLEARSPQAEPIAAARPRQLAIEVIEGSEGEYAVLFSSWSSGATGASLSCCIGFANGARSCSNWRDLGFPLVEGNISYDKDSHTLTVVSPCFGEKEAMDYDAELVVLEGIDFSANRGAIESLQTLYTQAQQGPDDLSPAQYVVRRAVDWMPERSNVAPVYDSPVTLTVKNELRRCPGLAPLAKGEKPLRNVWTGDIVLPNPPPTRLDSAVQRVTREDTFGVAAFRFEDVDVLGFRVELDMRRPEVEAALEELVRPLNFHLEGDAGAQAGPETSPYATTSDPQTATVPDFRYRVASPTVLIEVLRYGKMKLKSPRLPLGMLDYQSQHELLVRVLVGRVDDDTAQAHSPAVYVPAIFVDNPWSKALGRDVQGFDKYLADFCVLRRNAPKSLRPDGLARGENTQGPTPLTDLKQISLVKMVGAPPGSPFLEIDCSGARNSLDEPFEQIDLDLALGSSNLSIGRWRQVDFEDPEYRRSFARSASASTLHGFRSIQVSPVGNRPFDRTWITGTFVVDDTVQIARPSAITSLTIHHDADAPEGWRLLCELVGAEVDKPATLSFPSGSWYLMKCSMELVIDNGLD